jgi:hypothetical protein
MEAILGKKNKRCTNSVGEYSQVAPKTMALISTRLGSVVPELPHILGVEDVDDVGRQLVLDFLLRQAGATG